MAVVTKNFLDIFKAIGKHEFVIHQKDYLKSVQNHPVLKGIWTSGPWFCFLANIATKKIEWAEGQSENVLGYTTKEILTKNERFVEEMIHPDDFDFIVKVIHQGISLIQQVSDEQKEGIYIVFQHRSLTKDGNVIITQNQNIPLLFDEHRFPFLFANIITNITHLSPAIIPQATLINKTTDEIFYLDPRQLDLSLTPGLFTSREKEIIKLLIEGNDSRRIAELLNLSYETIRTHRKNILRKAGVHSTVELIAHISRNQWFI